MKEFFCRLFTPWRAGAQFDAPEAFYGFLLARNKLLGIIRNLCFGAALSMIIDMIFRFFSYTRVYLKTHDVTGSEGFLRCARHFFAGILTYFKEK